MATLVASPPATTPRGPSEMSHPFTCNTCQVAFRSSNLQRTHMQSDWHRYNLKRRVASLPPLTSEVFNDKVLANQASAAATAAKAAFEKICVPCQRTYFSENAYQNHLGSQKHKIKVSLAAAQADALDDDATSMTSSALSLGEPISITKSLHDPMAEAEFSDVISGLKNATLGNSDESSAPRRPHRPSRSVSELREEHPLSPEKSRGTDEAETASTVTEQQSSVQSCLFCSAEASSLEANVVHMERVHSLFIPERFYLVDLPGLIGYLHDKVSVLHECLFCGQLKRTTEGAKTHMRDKGHCMIAFESEEEMIEVGQFYDFRSTYSDDEFDDEDDEEDTDMSHAGGVKLGAARIATDRFVPVNEDANTDGEGSEEGEGWETDGSEEEEDVDAEDTADTTSRKARRAAKAAPQAVYYDDFELHLPSGRTAGHRSLSRYYRQNLTRYPTAAERETQLAIQDADAAPSEQQQPQGRGRDLIARSTREQGLQGLSTLQRREVQTVEFRERKKAQRAETKYRWGNEKRGNAQKHYRDQLLQ